MGSRGPRLVLEAEAEMLPIVADGKSNSQDSLPDSHHRFHDERVP